MRVTEPQVDPATGKRLGLFHDSMQRPKWIAGGAGIVSTASDYARFCQMFLNGGIIELMSANHLPPGIKFNPVSYPMFEAIIPSPEVPCVPRQAEMHCMGQ
ncbi:MAG: hypothetical protein ABSG75_04265 [Syntrophales bacterium]